VPRFRVPSSELERERVRLTGGTLRHLRHVLRLRPGDAIELFDGEGRAVAAELVSVSAAAAEARVIGPAVGARESPLSLVLGVAMIKGAKVDWVVEKATELGVAEIRTFLSERTVPETGEANARVARWRRIAEAAAAQCGRARVPAIAAPTRFDEVVGSLAALPLRVLLWEDGGESLAMIRQRVGEVPAAAIVTGPEGGFSGAEVETARAAGFTIAGLGPRVLRAETAAVAAVAIVQLLWGDLVATARRMA
jgi:16S rRNA (uracil1498-N3)-methyltransferase